MQSAARRLDEGTPFSRNFNRGVHRRLLKSVGAYRTVSWIVETMGLEVNNMLQQIPHRNGRAERNQRSALWNS